MFINVVDENYVRQTLGGKLIFLVEISGVGKVHPTMKRREQCYYLGGLGNQVNLIICFKKRTHYYYNSN